MSWLKGLKLVPLAFFEQIEALGEFTLFFFSTFASMPTSLRKRRTLFLQNCEFIGLNTLPICTTAAIFLGAVLAYQLYISLHQFQAEALIGGTIGVTLFRELAPVMAGIMVIGRGAAAIAAHLSSQRINEQVDALEVMGIDPFEYLVAPKVAACIVMMPLIVVFFGLTASLSAYIVSSFVMGLEGSTFVNHFLITLNPIDIIHCLTKSFVFGIFFSCISCFFGLKAYGGAQAVGFATRNTVVFSTLTILLVDYFLTSFLPVGLSRLELM